MQQVLLRIPAPWTTEGIPIYGFGMMLFIAFILCTWMAGRRAEREGVSKEYVQDVAIWLFLGGLLGARITSLVTENRVSGVWDLIRQLPLIWEGGIVLYGSLLGGLAAYLLGYLLYFRKQNVPTLKLADIFMPALATGIALGRIGCFLNGCCFGQVACADCPVYAVHFPPAAPARDVLVADGYQTAAGFLLADDFRAVRVGAIAPDSPADKAGLRPGDEILELDGLKVTQPRDLDTYLMHRSPPPEGWSANTPRIQQGWPRGKNDLTMTIQRPGEDGERQIHFVPLTIGLQPTQLYETISMGLLLLVLLAFWPFRSRDGQVSALFMLGYGLHRYFNEMLRADRRPTGFETWGSVILIVAGVLLFAWLLTRPAQYHPEPPKQS